LEQKLKTVYILGAGFSCNAALPSQSEIGGQLLSHDDLAGPIEVNEAITGILTEFLECVFHLWDLREGCPELEDIYTCIDLSMESGHFLGPCYTPKKLRSIRQFLTHRIFQILEKRYRPSPDITSLLQHAAANQQCAFVTLNWDMVLEQHLGSLGFYPDYKCGAIPLNRMISSTNPAYILPVCKMHGSSNWAYCDNCKYLFYDPSVQTALHNQLFLFRHDFTLFGYTLAPELFSTIACPHCGIRHMSTHIATFSYRKSFRTNHFGRIWHEAELLLHNAAQWVFIGYSLPTADYDFKHLLKSAQLQLGLMDVPRLSIITKNDGGGLSPTVVRYMKFFGTRLQLGDIYQEGIPEYIYRNF
jgi:NAD-dependent SIR2 family protein deacetylase